MTEELKVIEGGNTGANAVLKTLTLTGFKSFIHPTTLEFPEGEYLKGLVLLKSATAPRAQPDEAA